MEMSLVPRLPSAMRLCRSSSNGPGLPSFLQLLIWLTFVKVQTHSDSISPAAKDDKMTLERPQVVRMRSVFNILTATSA